jgi:3-deoxy-manno-octulosonate cytidylyltransferase (CMP-KDO synthetase)|tara:strand:+ start:111 stop:872 length:762 start_codon:yes stop_codon:yes gene_type:complete
MSSDVIGVIPARMGSSRFPGKPIASILGYPMVFHVWQRAKLSGVLDRIIVATCDDEIREVSESFGAEVVMTSSSHERSNDRVAEVATKVECQTILNIQGDEPLVHPQLIQDVVNELDNNPAYQCINPIAELTSEEEMQSPNTVKVVSNLKNRVVYFSRYPIPSALVNVRSYPVMRQVPILGFRSEFCIRLTELNPGPLELQEGIDLLRAIDHDLPVHVMETEFQTFGVDTEMDRLVVEERLKADNITRRYMDL